MKCTSKLKKKSRLLCLICIAALFVGGCKSTIENAYDPYSTDFMNGYNGVDYFASNSCVTNDVNFGDTANSSVAEGAGVFNMDTKEVKFNKNIFERLYPASTTKVLTAYIILKRCNMSDIVTVSKEAANPAESSSVCGLKEGDQISVMDLLYGLLLESGNDAAIALAEHCSGSVEAFADLMNQTAAKLGATQSNFVNPSGYPDENHYTTAYDLSLIAKYCMQNSVFRSIVSEQSCTINSTNKSDVRKYSNTNDLINPSSKYYLKECVGIKTGYTAQAKNCLIAASKKDNLELITVVLGAEATPDGRSGRYVSTINLFEYATN